MDRGSGKNRSQAAGWHPTPPVADAGKVGQHGVVGAKRFRTSCGNAPDPLGIHEDELGPPRGRSPAEHQAEDQQRNGCAALAGDLALAGKQRRNEKQALVAAAHGQGGGGYPTEGAGMIGRPWMGVAVRTPRVLQSLHSVAIPPTLRFDQRFSAAYHTLPPLSGQKLLTSAAASSMVFAVGKDRQIGFSEPRALTPADVAAEQQQARRGVLRLVRPLRPSRRGRRAGHGALGHRWGLLARPLCPPSLGDARQDARKNRGLEQLREAA